MTIRTVLKVRLFILIKILKMLLKLFKTNSNFCFIYPRNIYNNNNMFVLIKKSSNADNLDHLVSQLNQQCTASWATRTESRTCTEPLSTPTTKIIWKYCTFTAYKNYWICKEIRSKFCARADKSNCYKFASLVHQQEIVA